MNSVMSGYINEFVLVYLDGILVYSSNADEHEMHLCKVFDCLQFHKLQAKLKSVSLANPMLNILGMLLTQMNCGLILTRWLLSWTGSHLLTSKAYSSF